MKYSVFLHDLNIYISNFYIPLYRFTRTFLFCISLKVQDTIARIIGIEISAVSIVYDVTDILSHSFFTEYSIVITLELLYSEKPRLQEIFLK